MADARITVDSLKATTKKKIEEEQEDKKKLSSVITDIISALTDDDRKKISKRLLEISQKEKLKEKSALIQKEVMEQEGKMSVLEKKLEETINYIQELNPIIERKKKKLDELVFQRISLKKKEREIADEMASINRFIENNITHKYAEMSGSLMEAIFKTEANENENENNKEEEEEEETEIINHQEVIPPQPYSHDSSSEVHSEEEENSSSDSNSEEIIISSSSSSSSSYSSSNDSSDSDNTTESDYEDDDNNNNNNHNDNDNPKKVVKKTKLSGTPRQRVMKKLGMKSPRSITTGGKTPIFNNNNTRTRGRKRKEPGKNKPLTTVTTNGNNNKKDNLSSEVINKKRKRSTVLKNSSKGKSKYFQRISLICNGSYCIQSCKHDKSLFEKNSGGIWQNFINSEPGSEEYYKAREKVTFLEDGCVCDDCGNGHSLCECKEGLVTKEMKETKLVDYRRNPYKKVVSVRNENKTLAGFIKLCNKYHEKNPNKKTKNFNSLCTRFSSYNRLWIEHKHSHYCEETKKVVMHEEDLSNFFVFLFEHSEYCRTDDPISTPMYCVLCELEMPTGTKQRNLCARCKIIIQRNQVAHHPWIKESIERFLGKKK
jgi:hypothetical protein